MHTSGGVGIYPLFYQWGCFYLPLLATAGWCLILIVAAFWSYLPSLVCDIPKTCQNYCWWRTAVDSFYFIGRSFREMSVDIS